MTQPRRRLIRTQTASRTADPQVQKRLQRLKKRLEHLRVAQARWLTRLRAAYHQLEALEDQIVLIEQEIRRWEGS